MTERPEHSPLGASSAERWMNCPGSVHLIRNLQLPPSDEPEYRSLGTSAHLALNKCLSENLEAWEVMGQKFGVHVCDDDMANAIQVFLDEANQDRDFALGNPRMKTKFLFEQQIDYPEFHEQFYGTLDYAFIYNRVLKIRDYKHGQGIAVEVKDNPQVLYYAWGVLRAHPEIDRVDLGIIQPRAFHPDGPVRTWSTTAEDLRVWAETVLRPAMQRAELDVDFLPGSWCRFCPAKLVCPVLKGMFEAAAVCDQTHIQQYSRADLDRQFGCIAAVNSFIKALKEEVERRALLGEVFTSAKLVNRKSDRVWKAGAEKALVELAGQKALTTPQLISPAQMEKLAVPGIAKKVREFAFTPDLGVTLAPATDKRAAQVAPPKASEVFAEAIKNLEE